MRNKVRTLEGINERGMSGIGKSDVPHRAEKKYEKLVPTRKNELRKYLKMGCGNKNQKTGTGWKSEQ